MFENITDNGFLSILHSCTKKPLSLWGKKIRNGNIKRVHDLELQSLVLEVTANKMNNTYITCPRDVKKTLGVKFPFLIFTLKNMNRFFAFDVQILDELNVRRRFRVSTLTMNADVKPFTCKLPLVLDEGWNEIVFPLQDFTKRIYNTNYTETLRIQIYPNCRIRRVYFTNKPYAEEDSFADFSQTPGESVLLKAEMVSAIMCANFFSESGLFRRKIFFSRPCSEKSRLEEFMGEIYETEERGEKTTGKVLHKEDGRKHKL